MTFQTGMGYLRDAMTVTECLHTFCKPCIMQHFSEYLTCPTCEKDLGPAPHEKVRTDRAMQNIVDKVFPHFAKEESVGEKSIQREAEAGTKAREETSAESEAKRRKVASKVAMKKKMQQTQKNSEGGNKKLCLSLFPQEESTKPLPKLLKPYLRSSVEATVKQYKNYLCSKLKQDHNYEVAAVDIEILCRGAPLKNDLSLKTVWSDCWNSTSDLELTYLLKT
ncbi:hypothetical protein GUITHDRAFT_116084 [Guillardia theta CCMP2712]|uniref:Uncharacterized protein n=2 Tax=Guillardia theta TaxID=55529 RepID=L1INF6_GUITC|nr:hypothetical protein GUITHDRAFT_116084 [Guillardia theta CCMP2712]EKX37778.1 hypothetical protein GUITHDRAFT_116084 [Guillardia theta CCMP2712]|eukprot:XP_005824758.1 hypothetical protein GUITHDRAFT_116084 [Guillardia theta CCMP2712]